MDVHSLTTRSYNMSKIKSANTSLEINFRRILQKNGIRGYRIKNSLPGKPDIYFPKKKTAIFLDGCFWHKCKKCYIAPLTNSSFWKEKVNRNKKRDREINHQLKEIGIKVIRIWEHEIKRKKFSLNIFT